MLVKIVEYVLAEPEQPNFNAADSNGKYVNYGAVLFVNKSLYGATKQAMRNAKDLVVVSSNFKDLPLRLFFGGVPIVSDHAINKIKCHAMRLHIKVPRQRFTVASSILMHKKDMEDLAKIVRVLSLDPTYTLTPSEIIVSELHSRRYPHLFTRDYTPLAMKVRFQHVDGRELTTEAKRSLIAPLELFNRIGKITIADCSDAILSAMLPGRNEIFRPQTNRETADSYRQKSQEWLEKHRKEDAEDYVAIGAWMIALGDAALNNGNADLALHRYDLAYWLGEVGPNSMTMRFIEEGYGALQRPKFLAFSMLHMAESYLALDDIKSAGYLIDRSTSFKFYNIGTQTTIFDIAKFDRRGEECAEELGYLHDLRTKIVKLQIAENKPIWRGRWPEAWSAGWYWQVPYSHEDNSTDEKRSQTAGATRL